MRHRSLPLVGAAVLALVVSGCSSEKPGDTSATNSSAGANACSGANVAYASFDSKQPFIALVDQSVKQAASAAGVKLYFVDNAFSADKALSNAELIAARPDIKVVLEFNYYQAANATIAATFKRANMPVIAIDIPVPDAPFYGANNYEAGQLAGGGLVDAAKSKWNGQVDLLLVEKQSGAGQELLQQRTDGIVAGAKAALPSLQDSQIVKFEGGANVDAARAAVAAQLTAHPNAKHVLIGMLGDANAVAAANAAQEAGRAADVLTAGQGGDDVGRAALKGPETSFIGTTDYRPNKYGDDLIPLACDVVSGKQIPSKNYVKHVFLTRSNLQTYYP